MRLIALSLGYVWTLVARSRYLFVKAGSGGAGPAADGNAAWDYLYARPLPLPRSPFAFLHRLEAGLVAACEVALARAQPLYERARTLVNDRLPKVRPLSPGARRELAWRLNRARCMTPAEMAHRAVRAARVGWDPLESTCRHASLSIL